MRKTLKNRKGGARASSTTRSSRRIARNRSYRKSKSFRKLSGINASVKLSRRKGKSFRQMRTIPESMMMNVQSSSMVTGMRHPRAAKIKAELKRQQQKQGESLSRQVKELKKQQKQHDKTEMNALSKLMQGL